MSRFFNRKLSVLCLLGTVVSCGEVVVVEDALEGAAYVSAEIMATVDQASYIGLELDSDQNIGFVGTCLGTQPTCVEGLKRLSFENSCGLGESTYSGNGIALVYSTSLCLLNTVRQQMLMVPNYTVSGPRRENSVVLAEGANGHLFTFGLSKSGAEVLYYQISSYTRAVSDRLETERTAYTATVSGRSAMTIQGASREGRVLSGGIVDVSLVDTEGDSKGSLELTPSAVTWGRNCTCATSGAFEGSYTDSNGDSFVLAIELSSQCTSVNVKVSETGGKVVSEQEVDVEACQSI